MGAGRVLCVDVLRRRMRTCVLSVSSTVGRLIPALRSAETKIIIRLDARAMSMHEVGYYIALTELQS